MRLTSVLFLAAVLSGCALRPRYADFVTPRTDSKELTFLLTDAATQLPIPNARVELSELRNRLILTTAPDGTFKVPVERKYLDENPVFVVTLPKGFDRYRLSLAVMPVPPVAPVIPAPAPEPVPAAPESSPDAGAPVSNG